MISIKWKTKTLLYFSDFYLYVIIYSISYWYVLIVFPFLLLRMCNLGPLSLLGAQAQLPDLGHSLDFPLDWVCCWFKTCWAWPACQRNSKSPVLLPPLLIVFVVLYCFCVYTYFGKLIVLDILIFWLLFFRKIRQTETHMQKGYTRSRGSLTLMFEY